MEIKKENAIAAYNAADENTKKVLLSLLPELKEEIRSNDITKRVKTFEDACRELGNEHPFVLAYHQSVNLFTPAVAESNRDIIAYMKLRIICVALNEGLKPQPTEDECRWFPWFTLWTEKELSEKSAEWKADRHLISIDDYSGDYVGFASAFSFNLHPRATSDIGSLLCLKSEALATYCGKQFIEIWADFNLIKK